ncbi:MAG: DUF3971 domain-containing protein [Pseudomonadota bacterium]
MSNENKNTKRSEEKRSSASDFSRFPSHQGKVGRVRAPVHRKRRGRNTVFALLALVVVLPFGALLFAPSLLTPFLSRIAEGVIQSSAPDDWNIETTNPTFAFNLPAAVGVSYPQITASRRDGEAAIGVTNVAVTFGAISLIRRDPKVTALSADLISAELPGGGTPIDPLEIARDLDGLKNLAAATLGSVRNQLIRRFLGAEIAVGEISVIQNGVVPRTLSTLTVEVGDAINIATRIHQPAIDNQKAREIPVSALITAVPGTDDVASIAIETGPIRVPVRGYLRAFSNDPGDREPGVANDFQDVRFTGSLNATTPTQSALQLRIETGTLPLKLAKGDFLPVSVPISVSHRSGDQSISIRPATATVGQSRFVVSGGVRLSPNEENRKVEFEIIANDGQLAPSDTVGAALPFAARARGTFDLGSRLLDVINAEVSTDQGALTGRGEIDFSTTVPVTAAKIFGERLSVYALQKMWPAPIGRGARRWVINNVAGGFATNVQFDVVEPLRRFDPETRERIPGDTRVELDVEGVRFDIAGQLPPVRQAKGRIVFDRGTTTVRFDEGRLFVGDGLSTNVSDGQLEIGEGGADGNIPAQLSVNFAGTSRAVGELITRPPINAQRFYEFAPTNLSGDLSGRLDMEFTLNDIGANGGPDWSVNFDVADAGSSVPIEGRSFRGLNGSVQIDRSRAIVDVEGLMDGLDADLALVIPFPGSDIKADRRIEITLDDEDRQKLAPGLAAVLTGPTPLVVSDLGGGRNRIEANLTNAVLSVPWLPTKKGREIKASAAFTIVPDGASTLLDDFTLTSNTIRAAGSIRVDQGGLLRARLRNVSLVEGDDFDLFIERSGSGYTIEVTGRRIDARSIIRQTRTSMAATGGGGIVPLSISGNVSRVVGFGGLTARNVAISVTTVAEGTQRVRINGQMQSTLPFSVSLDGIGSGRSISINALDAGEILTFVDLYGQVRGGVLDVNLRGGGSTPVQGTARISDFAVFNEPRLERLVATRGGNQGSLEEVTGREIDTSQVRFEVASANLSMQNGALDLQDAILRGPLLGLRLRGTAYDANNRMNLAGTFMPAYGLNTIFAEIPILGAFLGNGRDRGLIGVTFRLSGDAKAPNVQVNPLSVIAPGIFRSIFEFR